MFVFDLCGHTKIESTVWYLGIDPRFCSYCADRRPCRYRGALPPPMAASVTGRVKLSAEVELFGRLALQRSRECRRRAGTLIARERKFDGFSRFCQCTKHGCARRHRLACRAERSSLRLKHLRSRDVKVAYRIASGQPGRRDSGSYAIACGPVDAAVPQLRQMGETVSCAQFR